MLTSWVGKLSGATVKWNEGLRCTGCTLLEEKRGVIQSYTEKSGAKMAPHWNFLEKRFHFVKGTTAGPASSSIPSLYSM